MNYYKEIIDILGPPQSLVNGDIESGVKVQQIDCQNKNGHDYECAVIFRHNEVTDICLTLPTAYGMTTAIIYIPFQIELMCSECQPAVSYGVNIFIDTGHRVRPLKNQRLDGVGWVGVSMENLQLLADISLDKEQVEGFIDEFRLGLV